MPTLKGCYKKNWLLRSRKAKKAVTEVFLSCQKCNKNYFKEGVNDNGKCYCEIKINIERLTV